MLIEGVKLLVLGMTIVFVFLIILMWSISALGRYCAEASAAELKAETEERRREAAPEKQLIGVIAAAIAAHRMRLQKIVR
jgi:sodium pump decarboxylase gamma subunit